MTNPRRRRTVIMVITLGFILMAQGPNLYFNVFARHSSEHHSVKAQSPGAQPMFDSLVTVQGFIPPLWVSVGAQGLAEKRVLPAVYGTLGCICLAGWGLLRAYRSTVMFYHGDTGGKSSVRSRAGNYRAGAP